MNFEQRRALLRLLSFSRTAEVDLRQRNAQLLRDGSYRFRKSNILDLLDEAEHISGSSTTETVIELA